jgi:hypothetical protein
LPKGHGKAFNLYLTIESLTIGDRFKCSSIAEILEYEKEIKNACKIFKTYLNTMRDFGGTEEIEY